MVKSGPRPGFARNTLWTWTSSALSLTTALVVTPLMIRYLGAEAYGLWILAFGVAEYYSIADFGVRSAVLKEVAVHSARGDTAALHATFDTAFVYFAAAGLLTLAASLIIAPLGPALFPEITPAMAGTFVVLLAATGVSMALAFSVTWLGAVLESVQRFDVSYRIIITANLVRVIGTIGALLLGYGLVTVVAVSVVARVIESVLVYRAFRRIFSDWRWSWAGVTRRTFRGLLGYGVFALPSNAARMLIEQGPAVIIGHQAPAQFVAYFMMPRRLLQTVMTLVYGIGAVTTSRSAQLAALGDRHALVHLAIQTNRYGLAVFMPAAVFVIIYGADVFRVWLTPEFAVRSAPMLAVFAVGIVFADASQFSASSMLYGLARHQAFSVLLVCEAVISSALVFYFARSGSVWLAAIACAAAMILNRGLLTPWLLCRYLRYPLARYLTAVIVPPVTAGLLTGLVMMICHSTWLPGRTYPHIGVAILLTSGLFLVIGGRLCVFPEHHSWVLTIIRGRAPWAEAPVRAWLGIPATTPSVA